MRRLKYIIINKLPQD